MAELVDALVSGTSTRKGVQVRVLFRAQGKIKAKNKGIVMLCPSPPEKITNRVLLMFLKTT